MTISSTTSPKIQYNGDDATTAFATSFVFVAEGDLKVYVDDTLQTITTDYTVSGGGTPAATGTVTMLTAPASGEVLTITRESTFTQGTDYVENDAFPAAAHESALDKLTLIAQEIDQKFGRTVLQSVTSTVEGLVLPAPTALNYLRWNAAGTALENSAISASGLAAISEDTTPQLGGNLDVNGFDITSPDGTDLIDIVDGTIDIQTDSSSRIDITDSGIRLGGANSRVTTILDEDTMSSDSATALATQQSIKAYVDAAAGGGGGAGLEFISTTSIAASSTEVEFTGISGYDRYTFVMSGITAETANFNIELTYATSGTSYYTDGYMYSRNANATSIGNISSVSSITIMPNNVSGGVSSGVITIEDGSALAFPVFSCTGSQYNAQNSLNAGFNASLFSGTCGSNSEDRRGTVTAVKFTISGGDTFAGGTISLYGFNYPTS